MYRLPEDPENLDGPNRIDFGDFGWKSLVAFHEMLSTASRVGSNVIADHLMFVEPPVL